MTMIEKIFGIALLTLSMPIAAGAEPVRVAHHTLFPPFSELKEGKSFGLAVDILRAAADRAGLEVELVPLPFEQLEPALKERRVQAVFPLAVTPERRQTLDFSATLLTTGGALYVRAPERTPAGLQALAGKTVVTPRTGPLAALIQKTAPDVKLVLTKDYEESLARLVAGEADAAALNYQAGALIAARLYPGKITVPQTLFQETALPIAVMVLKGENADFLSKLNTGLVAIRADGTWDRINNGWMGR